MGDFNYSLSQVEKLCIKEFGWQGEMSQNGEFVCYCPIHGDKNASLSVGLKHGSIMIKCWSHGCEKEIYSDLTKRGAWPQQMDKEDVDNANKIYEKKYPERSQPRYEWNAIQSTHRNAVNYSKKIKDTIVLDEEGSKIKFSKTMVHVYTDGDFAHSIVARYDAPGRKKRIFQYSLGYYTEHEDVNKPTDPSNPKWQIKAWPYDVDNKHMLYALTYLIGKPDATVVIVEGEKAADYGNTYIAAKYRDYVFTTWKGGTRAIPYTNLAPLHNRRIIMIPDNDGAGVLAAKSMYDALMDQTDGNCDISITDIQSFDIPEKWDIADYTDGNTVHPKFVDLISNTRDDFKEKSADQIKKEVDSGGGGNGNKDNTTGGGNNGGRRKNTDYDDYLVDPIRFPYSEDGSNMHDAVSYFNDRFGQLYEGGKKYVVSIDLLKKQPEKAKIPESVFHSIMQHVRIQFVAKGAYKPASVFWMRQAHRTFDEGTVNPSKPHTYIDKDGLKTVNFWPGFAAEEMDQSGSCKKFLNHLEYVCSEDKTGVLYEFIVTWLARMVQTPDKRQGAILLFRGNQGSGKSLIGEYLQEMLGLKAAISVNSLKRITGQFTSKLEGKVLCRVEEAKIPKGEMYEILKDLAVNKVFSMEGKGENEVIRPNYLHLIFTGNYDYIAPVGATERRTVPVNVPDDKIGDLDYFAEIFEEMENGGPGALFKYLMEYKVPTHFLKIPETKALADQRVETKTYSNESIFFEWYSKSLRLAAIQSGEGGPIYTQWDENTEMPRTLMWQSFDAWQVDYNSKRRDSRSLGRRGFYKCLDLFSYGKTSGTNDIHNSKKGRFECRYSGIPLIRMPNLLDAKDTFCAYFGGDEFEVYTVDDIQTTLDVSVDNESEA